MWTAYVHKEGGGVDEYQIGAPVVLRWFENRYYSLYAHVESTKKAFYSWTPEPDLRMLVAVTRAQKGVE